MPFELINDIDWLLFNCCVSSEWSAIEKEMGDGLQSAGHHMDT